MWALHGEPGTLPAPWLHGAVLPVAAAAQDRWMPRCHTVCSSSSAPRLQLSTVLLNAALWVMHCWVMDTDVADLYYGHKKLKPHAEEEKPCNGEQGKD